MEVVRPAVLFVSPRFTVLPTFVLFSVIVTPEIASEITLEALVTGTPAIVKLALSAATVSWKF